VRDAFGPRLSRLLEPLFEAAEDGSGPLPDSLAEIYGGQLSLGRPLLYANFVTSLDGVTAIHPPAEGQGGVISGGAPADRFLMGLLRAFADVVLIGAGTLRAEPRHRWTAARAYPAAAEGYAELRRRLGLAPDPPLAVLTASGRVDAGLPGLAGGLILTTPTGAAALAGSTPAGVRVEAVGEGPQLPASAAVDVLHAAGYESILSEGGPHLFGELLGARLVDELFLTLSPVLVGREPGGAELGLVEGTSLPPGLDNHALLRGARRSGSHLFLRYRLG
jgi:riboflavin biosynthesis pyrimidine reductase